MGVQEAERLLAGVQLSLATARAAHESLKPKLTPEQKEAVPPKTKRRSRTNVPALVSGFAAIRRRQDFHIPQRNTMTPLHIIQNESKKGNAVALPNRGRLDSERAECYNKEEYAWFVERVRANQRTAGTLEEAIDAALAQLADNAVIKPFLLANQAEVKYMCITEYDEEKTLAGLREEYREEYREEGRREGRQEGIGIGKLNLLIDLFNEGILTLRQAAERAGMSEREFEAKAHTAV